MRHLLRDDDLNSAEQAEILALAAAMKADPYGAEAGKPLAGPRSVAMIFDKPTLRTQSSFAAGIAELGGNPMLVDGILAGIGIRESIADVARVLGRQVSAIVWRTGDQSRVDEMAAHAGVPVVNALTDQFHPCQLLADLLTITEHRGATAGQTLAFVGDIGCNMGHSTLLAGALAGMHIRVSGPAAFAPDPEILALAQQLAADTGGSAVFVDDPGDAATGADVLVTDTWVSMGKEDEAAERVATFTPWQLNDRLVDLAAPDAIVMHCLPAYRGKEISAEVIDGPHSVVWDQAENRRHAQKAVLAWLLDEKRLSS